MGSEKCQLLSWRAFFCRVLKKEGSHWSWKRIYKVPDYGAFIAIHQEKITIHIFKSPNIKWEYICLVQALMAAAVGYFP